MLGSVIPLLAIVTYAVLAALLPRLSKAMSDAPLRSANAVGLGMQSLYTGLFLHGIKLFIYVRHPNGEKSLLASGEILVGSSTHDKLAVLACVHLALYGGGFACVCAVGMYKLRQRARSGRARGVQAIMWFSFLFFFYWGTLIGDFIRGLY